MSASITIWVHESLYFTTIKFHCLLSMAQDLNVYKTLSMLSNLNPKNYGHSCSQWSLLASNSDFPLSFQSRSMSDESPTEDVLGDCFEPRDETVSLLGLWLWFWHKWRALIFMPTLLAKSLVEKDDDDFCSLVSYPQLQDFFLRNAWCFDCRPISRTLRCVRMERKTKPTLLCRSLCATPRNMLLFWRPTCATEWKRR